MKFLALPLVLLLCSTPKLAAQQLPVPAAIDELLDGFHQAAADADMEAYLGYFTDDGVFFGTDPAERWPLDEFRPYVASRFQNGVGWTYVPRDRTVFVAPDRSVAWFDEVLESPGGTIARGTGVLMRDGDRWKLAQYNFSIPFPNALWDQILAAIREAEGR